jgi:hypothetical protein
MAAQGRRFRGPLPCRTTAALTLLVLGACLTSSCSTQSHAAAGGRSSPPSSPSAIARAGTAAPIPASSSSSEPSASAQAINAYNGMWQDFVTAGRTSDWQSPLLGDHATGDALLQMSRGLYADHYNGLITRGVPVDHPVVKSATPAADPTTVIINDCGDSSHFVKYYANSGQLASGADGGRRLITAEALKGPQGTWKVDRFAVEDVGTC